MSATTTHLGLRDGDLGEYAIVCGSASRTTQVGARLDRARMITNNRLMHCVTGFLKGRRTRVTAVTHGMGCPSAAIALRELIDVATCTHQRLTVIRLGTCGSLQDDIRVGQTMIVQAAVRDEHTSDSCVPKEFPAFADLTVLDAQRKAAQKLGIECPVVLAHTKDDLNRELRQGNVPLADENERYMRMLEQARVGVSSMEESALFIIGWLNKVRVGSFMTVIGSRNQPFDPNMTHDFSEGISLALETIRILAREGR